MNSRSNAEQLRVAVVFGGRSGEHEFSSISPASVINARRSRKCHVLAVYLKWLATEGK